MPQNITPVVEFTTPIQGVADSDPVNAAITNLSAQGLTNRTEDLNTRLTALEATVAGNVSTLGLFAPDRHFYETPAPVVISEVGGDPFQTVANYNLTLAGGNYDFWIEFVYGSTSTDRDIAVQMLLDDVLTAPPVSRQLNDPDDEIVITRFGSLNLAAATYNFKVQMQLPSGGGTPDATLIDHKILFTRYST